MHLLHSQMPTDRGASWLLARDMEATCHACCYDREHYTALVLKCAKNVYSGATARPQMALEDDDDLTHGSFLRLLREREQHRRELFQRMLQEKCESIDAKQEFKSSLQCRRCKSTDVSWEIKQTRSADEGSSAFCVCGSCGNRWTIR